MRNKLIPKCQTASGFKNKGESEINYDTIFQGLEQTDYKKLGGKL